MWIKWTKKTEKIETNILKRLPWSKPQIDSADDNMIRSSSVSWGTCIRHLPRILSLAREKKNGFGWVNFAQKPRDPLFFIKWRPRRTLFRKDGRKMPARFHPTKAFQAYQIFAANTNVGKTIFATGLCRAASIVAKEKNREVYYLKPVQTGYPVDSDERFVKHASAN